MNDTIFKVGDKVRVIRRSNPGEVYWATKMDKSIGKIRTVLGVSINNLLLDDMFLYPKNAVQEVCTKNEQLLFDFMNEVT